MKIDKRYFIVSLALGLFYVYLSDDPPTIVVYPTPDNIDKFQYKKPSGSCFSYDLQEVTCPQDTRIHNVDKNNGL
jgi:hypothetical protein